MDYHCFLNEVQAVCSVSCESSHYLATVLHAFRAVHHNVDFGVGPSTSDVSCHNLDVVHNTWRVQLRFGLSEALPTGS